MTDQKEISVNPKQSLRDIAREEFWIVAKSFFAPVYGPVLVLRQLLRLTKAVDRSNAGRTPYKREKYLSPAE